LKERQREARQDWILMRVTTVILVLTAAAVLVIISLIIATQS
jgi:succinate dehydrogenase hydrophobic anchor subunit